MSKTADQMPLLDAEPQLYYQLPADLQPINRLQHAGAGVLSTSELVSLVLGEGKNRRGLRLAESLLAQTGGLHGLGRSNFYELTQFPQIGPARAAALLAVIELVKRFHAFHPGDRPQIRTPADVAELVLAEMALLDVEQLRIALLDTKNYLQHIETIYSGNVNTAIVRVAEVYRPAIRINAPAIILIHNHPSGDPTPSPEDVHVTQLLYTAGKDLDIQLLDHLIIGRNRFVSLKERGLGFN